MNTQRILYPYVALTQVPTGKRVDLLADLIASMAVRDAEGTTDDGTKKTFEFTEITTPFGVKYPVLETPDQIAVGIERAMNQAMKNTQQAMQSGLVLAKGQI